MCNPLYFREEKQKSAALKQCDDPVFPDKILKEFLKECKNRIKKINKLIKYVLVLAGQL